MKKEEIINEIISELRNANGGYEIFHIYKVVPEEKKHNARFPFIVAHAITVGTLHSKKGNTEELYYCADNGSTVTWRCNNLDKYTLKKLLEAIKESKKEYVYVVVRDEAFDYDATVEILCVTKDETTARQCFSDEYARIRAEALDNGWELEESDDSIEAYEEGYAAMNHQYARITKELLV